MTAFPLFCCFVVLLIPAFESVPGTPEAAGINPLRIQGRAGTYARRGIVGICSEE